MVDITAQMARAELAKRELASRGNPYRGEDEQPQYDDGADSAMGKFGEYLQGLAPGLLQSGAEGGRDVARAISWPARALYGRATGKPTYQLPEVDVMGMAPNTEAGELGARVGHGTGELAQMMMPLIEAGKLGKAVAPGIASKAGDIAPVFKSIAKTPYKKQMGVLAEKDLLGGYKPNVPDILEASRVLKSPGMAVEHEAVDEAVAQALGGNFHPWFGLQSSVKAEGRRLSKKGGVHRALGDKLYNLGEKMHTEMGEAQAARGAPEARDFMNQGQQRTARYHQISPYSRAAKRVAGVAALPAWVRHLSNLL